MMFLVVLLLTAALARAQDQTGLYTSTPKKPHGKHHKGVSITTTLTSLPIAITSSSSFEDPAPFTSPEISVVAVTLTTPTTSTTLAAPTTPIIPTTTSTSRTTSVSIDTSATGTTTISSPTTPSSTITKTQVSHPTATPDVQGCYEALGGLKADGITYTGCGGLLAHFDTCFSSQGPWTNPYDTPQNFAFRACLCENSATAPFTPNSVFYQNFTGCMHCMLEAQTPDYAYMTQMMLSVDNFCRSQSPSAFLFIKDLKAWLQGLDRDSSLTAPPIPDVTPVVSQLQPLFTTTPPLANLAYGASAPWDGSLGGVTPEMTTYTTTGVNGTVTVTALVTWLPTEAGKTFDGAAASESAAAVAESDLSLSLTATGKTSSSPTSEQTYCYGRGPCQTGCSDAGAIGGRLGGWFWVCNALVLVKVLF